MKLTVCRSISFLIALNVPFCAALYAGEDSFIGSMHTIKAHASTVPSNGDVNPYGVGVVPAGVPTGGGKLLPQHVLVSNFNNSSNLQGTGTTIVQVSPGDGSTKLFAQIDAMGPGSRILSGRRRPDHGIGGSEIRMGDCRKLAHNGRHGCDGASRLPSGPE